MQRLRVLPGIDEVLNALQAKFQGRVDSLANFALERHAERVAEQKELFEALQEVSVVTFVPLVLPPF